MKPLFITSVSILLWCTTALLAQEFTIHAIDVDSGKSLEGILITLRYSCTSTGSGLQLKWHCKYLQRKTDANGIAHFPEAGSLQDIDDIYSLPITYGSVCCDVTPKTFPGTATMKFKRRTLSEMMHWIFIGD